MNANARGESAGTRFPWLDQLGVWILGCVCLLVVFAAIAPVSFGFMRGGLDPSWAAVLGEAHKMNLRFGVDLVFTGGPLSSLYSRYFTTENIWLIVALGVGQALFVTWMLVRRFLRVRFWAGLLMVLALAFTVGGRDAYFLIVPLLTGLDALERQARLPSWLTLSGIILSAALLLAKFSVAPLAFAIFLVVDIVAIVYRRMPVHVILLALFTPLMFVLTGSAIEDFPAFLIRSIQTSSGYTEAMSESGPIADIIAWPICAALLIAIMVGAAKREVSIRHAALLATAARVLLYLLFLFVAFKAGFVRHDAHVLIAWTALNITALLFVCDRWPLPHTLKAHLLIGLIVVVGVVLGHIFRHEWSKSRATFDVVAELGRGIRQLGLLGHIIRDHEGWLAQQVANQNRAIAVLRKAKPLPQLDGDIDMIPSRQTELIANGLRYRPRPTIQEYTSYSRPLMAMNRRFFTGESAPKHLLMAPGSIDKRHPASAEGALWPELFARYEPKLLLNDMLLMSRREALLPGLLADARQQTLQMDTALAIAAHQDPLFVKFDIEYTLFGRLLNILFKPSRLYLQVTYQDGGAERYRLIPGQAREGMVLSPLVTNTDEVLFLAAGTMDSLPWRRPATLRIEGGLLGGLTYRRDVALSIAPMRSDILRAAARGIPILQERRKWIGGITTLLLNNVLTPPSVMQISEGLLAHAPAKLVMPVVPGKKLALAFGIREGAWVELNTKGACFRVSSPEGGMLFERCLDPTQVEADRGVQEAIVPIPEGLAKVTLETACRVSCAGAWSYWQRAVVEND